MLLGLCRRVAPPLRVFGLSRLGIGAGALFVGLGLMANSACSFENFPEFGRLADHTSDVDSLGPSANDDEGGQDVGVGDGSGDSDSIPGETDGVEAGGDGTDAGDSVGEGTDTDAGVTSDDSVSTPSESASSSQESDTTSAETESEASTSGQEGDESSDLDADATEAEADSSGDESSDTGTTMGWIELLPIEGSDFWGTKGDNDYPDDLCPEHQVLYGFAGYLEGGSIQSLQGLCGELVRYTGEDHLRLERREPTPMRGPTSGKPWRRECPDNEVVFGFEMSVNDRAVTYLKPACAGVSVSPNLDLSSVGHHFLVGVGTPGVIHKDGNCSEVGLARGPTTKTSAHVTAMGVHCGQPILHARH